MRRSRGSRAALGGGSTRQVGCCGAPYLGAVPGLDRRGGSFACGPPGCACVEAGFIAVVGVGTGIAEVGGDRRGGGSLRRHSRQW